MIVRLTPPIYQFGIQLWPALLFIILFLFSGVSVSAQYLQPSFKNYTVDDGLPSSEVYVAIQDHDGYMWFGTDNGLSRFDGYEFKNYGTKDGLKSPVIFDLKIDEEGTLWICTMTGFVYKYQNEKIEPYEFNNRIAELTGQYAYATDIFMDTASKKLSINLESYGLVSIDSAGRSTTIHTAPREINILDTLDLFAFNHSRMNLFEIQRNTPFFINIRFPYSPKTPCISYEASSLSAGINVHKLQKDKYLIKTGDSFSLIENGKIEWRRDDVYVLNTLSQLDSKKLWLGLHEGLGIREYSSEENLEHGKSSSILIGSSISKIYKDHSNGIWVTSTNNGVFYSPNPQFLIYSDNKRPIESNFSAIAINKNTVYFSDWTGEIIMFNGKSKNTETIKKYQQDDGFKYQYNQDLEFNSQTKTLLGSTGLLYYEQDQWRKFHGHPKNSFPTIYKIGSKSFDNEAIISTRSGATTVHLIKKEITRTYKTLNKRFLYANFDNNGNKWVCRVDGLWQWIGDTLVRPDNLHPYFTERIESIEQLQNNNFVLGTKGRGVIIWDQENIIHQITEEDGLTSNMIENIFIDSLDQIWVGTLNGLNRIRINNDNNFLIKKFTKKQGLPGNEIRKVRRQGEFIWIATTTGIGRISDIEPDSTTFIPNVNNFIINGKKINPSSKEEFSHEENNMTIDFVSLDYESQGEINYRYRLQYNDEWRLTKNRTLNLPNLSPSSYNIEIQAQNQDGFWSESLSLQFTILSPFWQRPWFLIISGLLLSSIAAGVTRHRQLKEIETLKNEHDIQSQITELERSALQAQMNPHFIFNILNSIQSSINKEDNENASQILAKFAKLIRGTLQNAKAKSITIEEEINYIKSYLYLEQVRHKEERFQYEVTHDEEEDLLSIFIPPMLVQPYVENAVKHGTRNNKSAKIEVHYTIATSHVSVTVKDNGPGISKSPSLQNHQGLGMDITQRRLELLNEGTLDNFLKIEQIKNDADMVIGTQINLKIKTKNFQTV